MSGRVFDSYYPQQALTSVGRHKRRITLSESSEMQSYRRLWREAMNFMREQENNTVDLPLDSPEKLRIKAITGTLEKYKPNDSLSNEELRSQLDSLSNGLEELVDASSNHLSQYIAELVRGARELYTQIVPDGGEDEEAPKEGEDKPKEEGEVPDKEGGEQDKQAEEPEKPTKDSEELAQALGLHDSVRRMKKMRSNLCETDEQLKPGQTVVRVVNGELKKMQVVLDKSGQIALVDPEKLDKVDMVKRQDVAPSQDAR